MRTPGNGNYTLLIAISISYFDTSTGFIANAIKITEDNNLTLLNKPIDPVAAFPNNSAG
jgi:hypothetical protein